MKENSTGLKAEGRDGTDMLPQNIRQLLTDNCRRWALRTALIFEADRLTFEQLDLRSSQQAQALHAIYGIGKYMNVGIWSLNSIDYVILVLALMKLGAVPVPVNTLLTEREVAGIIDQCDIQVFFYGEGCRGRLYRHSAKVIAEECRTKPRITGIADLLRNQKKWEKTRNETVPYLPEVRSDDLACIMLTSGTIRRPKGVMLTYRNIFTNVRSAAHAMHWTHKDIECLAIPLFHCFGMITGLIGALSAGMTLCLLPSYHTEDVWQTIEEHECTVLSGVPSIFLAMTGKPPYSEMTADGLKSGIIGGAVITEKDYLRIMSHFPNMHLQPSYGLTEAAPSVTFADWDEPVETKAMTAGKVMENMQARIADQETGAILTDGEVGELQLLGPCIMKGYYKMPEETEEAFTDDGWLRTGDLACFTPEGKLIITGRAKEIIIRAGENISIAQLEHVIRRSGLVRDVKVVGIPSKFLQEEPAALVIPEDNYSEERLATYMKTRLAEYKIPRKIQTCDRMPLNGAGKTDRNLVRDMFLRGGTR